MVISLLDFHDILVKIVGATEERYFGELATLKIYKLKWISRKLHNDEEELKHNDQNPERSWNFQLQLKKILFCEKNEDGRSFLRSKVNRSHDDFMTSSWHPLWIIYDFFFTFWSNLRKWGNLGDFLSL